jgi:hypothetical protein
MAAAAIMGFALVVLLSSQAAAVTNTQRIIRQVQALAVAEAAMDEFLAQPFFEPDGARQIPDEELELAVPGFLGDPRNAPFRIYRIMSQRDPFIDQPQLDLYLEDEQAYLLTEEEEEEEEEEFDPGIYVSVRIEVREPNSQKVLAALVTWIPKPRIEEDQREEAAR